MRCDASIHAIILKIDSEHGHSFIVEVHIRPPAHSPIFFLCVMSRLGGIHGKRDGRGWAGLDWAA